MITCKTCFTPNAPDATHCVLCATVLMIHEACPVCPVCSGDCASANPPVVDCPMQPSLFTEPTATNTYPHVECAVHVKVECDAATVQALSERIERDTAIRNAALIEQISDKTFIQGASCDAVRAATDIQGATPLEWDDVTDWIDGSIVPHYIGWYDVQMRSRFNDDHAAEGITRFWFAGRDWFTGPRAAELEAPCVPRGNVFHWRGRAKP